MIFKRIYFFRKQAFNKTIQKINELNDQYNKGKLSHVSGINQFADLVYISFLHFFIVKLFKYEILFITASRRIFKFC